MAACYWYPSSRLSADTRKGLRPRIFVGDAADAKPPSFTTYTLAQLRRRHAAGGVRYVRCRYAGEPDQ